MRNWVSEIRIGLVAGLSAGAIVLLAPTLAPYAPSGPDARDTRSTSWTPPLTDPIQAAYATLARGDSAFIAITVHDTMEFPGLASEASMRTVDEPVRWYSRRSTGLPADQWAAFVPRVVPYAAAYNAVVHVARTSAKARP